VTGKGESRPRPRIHVSRPVPEPALAHLRELAEVTVGPDRLATEKELIAAARDADGLLSMLTDKIGEALLVACPRLRIVANCAVGYDNLDLAAGERHGVWMTNTPNVLTETTADLTFALLLAAARRLGEAERFFREGRYQGWGPLLFLGSEVNGRTLGIIGMGRIGRAVAARAAGFSMRVLFASRTPKEIPSASQVSLDVLLAQSDFLSVHVPLNDSTRHLISATALARMKRGAFLVNTSRGPVVDEAALAQALQSGQLGGAGLDVFEDEPRAHPDLLKAPNAVLLPHIASATVETRTAMALACAQDIQRVMEGKPPENALIKIPRPRTLE
jgi:glyoxylate reductase